MKIKTLAYLVLIAASGLLLYNIFQLNSDNTEEVSVPAIIGNILIIIAMILTIIGQYHKNNQT